MNKSFSQSAEIKLFNAMKKNRMNQTLFTWMLLGLATYATHCYAASDQPPGAAEYHAALATSERITALVEEAAQSGYDQEMIERQKKEVLKLYEQMQASSDKGFAPGRYIYALTLRAKSYSEEPGHETAKFEACNQLYDAGGADLLAGALAQAQDCLDLNESTKSESYRLQSIREVVRVMNNDAYSSYYPMRPFSKPQCFPIPEKFDKPMLLTLNQFRAESALFIAQWQVGTYNNSALKNLYIARGLGCSGGAYDEAFRKLKAASKS